jgi:catechol 2,3-dioxygenase-like lactoylglutathione lyase family enzyme
MISTRLLPESAVYRHFCYVTDDIDASIAAFKALGVTGLERRDVEELSYTLGDVSSDTQVEVAMPKNTTGIFGDFLERHGRGFHHIAYIVKDFDEAHRLLTDAGCISLYEAKGEHSNRKIHLALYDCQAVKLPLIEIAEFTELGH